LTIIKNNNKNPEDDSESLASETDMIEIYDSLITENLNSEK